MKKRIIQKLSKKAGESIAETLVALLISSLALLMLAGAIQSSAKIITQSKKKMEDYYAANKTVEMRTESGKGSIYVALEQVDAKETIMLTTDSASGDRSYRPLNYYVNRTLGEKPVISYGVPPKITG